MNTNTITIERIKNAKKLPWSVRVNGHEYGRFLAEPLARSFAETTLADHIERASEVIAKLAEVTK